MDAVVEATAKGTVSIIGNLNFPTIVDIVNIDMECHGMDIIVRNVSLMVRSSLKPHVFILF